MFRNFFNTNPIITKEMRHGSEQESFAVEAFKKMNPQLEISKIGIMICQKYPWLAYSPDGIIFDEGRPTSLLEIKCPYLGKIKSDIEIIHMLRYLNEDWTLKENHSYYAQIQLGIALLNLGKCEFLIFFSRDKNYLQILVPFNQNFTEELIKTASNKYFNNIIHHACD